MYTIDCFYLIAFTHTSVNASLCSTQVVSRNRPSHGFPYCNSSSISSNRGTQVRLCDIRRPLHGFTLQRNPFCSLGWHIWTCLLWFWIIIFRTCFFMLILSFSFIQVLNLVKWYLCCTGWCPWWQRVFVIIFWLHLWHWSRYWTCKTYLLPFCQCVDRRYRWGSFGTHPSRKRFCCNRSSPFWCHGKWVGRRGSCKRYLSFLLLCNTWDSRGVCSGVGLE